MMETQVKSTVLREEGNKLPLLPVCTLVLWEPSLDKNMLSVLCHPRTSRYMKWRRPSCGGKGQIIITWVLYFCPKILYACCVLKFCICTCKTVTCKNGGVRCLSAVCPRPPTAGRNALSVGRSDCFSNICSFASLPSSKDWLLPLTAFLV